MSTDENVWRPSEILERYKNGERDFRHLEINDPGPYVEEGGLLVSAGEPGSFTNAVLDGADFSFTFVVADFRGASLRGCKLINANVKTCRFDEADLTDCDFSNALLDAATFRSARLDGVNVNETTGCSSRPCSA